ncbi:hypothetical protein DL96DRAFT_1579972 [Flagelloscypha sp. PMI_526]|nr:hypothetical protein DL96DRAFT_1579972 [Flagelloscypha sp. PMI_526]
MRCLRWYALQVLALFLYVSAKPCNRTVDDYDIGSQYHPSLVYSEGWQNSTICRGCTAKPNATEALRRTWHDTTFKPGVNGSLKASVSLSFHGTAVYVFFILPLTTSSPNGHVSCTISIDGEDEDQFSHSPPGTPGYIYDSLVYSQLNLSNSTHNLTILNDAPDGLPSLILLDKIIFTDDDGDDSIDSSSANAEMPLTQNFTLSGGSIAGITLGALCVVSLFAFSVYFCWHGPKHRRKRDALKPRPFEARGNPYNPNSQTETEIVPAVRTRESRNSTLGSSTSTMMFAPPSVGHGQTRSQGSNSSGSHPTTTAFPGFPPVSRSKSPRRKSKRESGGATPTPLASHSEAEHSVENPL